MSLILRAEKYYHAGGLPVQYVHCHHLLYSRYCISKLSHTQWDSIANRQCNKDKAREKKNLLPNMDHALMHIWRACFPYHTFAYSFPEHIASAGGVFSPHQGGWLQKNPSLLNDPPFDLMID